MIQNGRRLLELIICVYFYIYLSFKLWHLNIKPLFDLDDTLWAFSLNARDTFEEMYHKYDYGRFFRSFLHFYTLYQHRNTELWEEYGRGQVSKEELNRQRFLYPLEAVGARDVALAEAFSDDFFSVIPTKIG